MTVRAGALATLLATTACGASPADPSRASRLATNPSTLPAPHVTERPWADATRSPVPLDAAPGPPVTADEAALVARCGDGDGALIDAARAVLARDRDAPPLDATILAVELRAAGAPHVWPRAAVFHADHGDRDGLARKLDAWIAHGDAPASRAAEARSPPYAAHVGERRCGVAIARDARGDDALAAIVVDAVADLAPLPIRARAGEWLSIDAHVLVAADAARVVIAGPDGAPHAVPSHFAEGRVRAQFAPDRPGAFVVQVVADVAGGPRPVLEARVFADEEPTRATAPAPGEGSSPPSALPADALAAMAFAVRSHASLPALTRDPSLDAVALSHANAMQRARLLAHDAGDGDPTSRVHDANIIAGTVGENVAHAATPALAHRALYASPSHRGNLLRGAFVRLGVGVATDADGSIWVTELFTDAPP